MICLPRHIFDRADHDPFVRKSLEFWMSGDLSWDQMLIMLVCRLSTERDHLMEGKQMVILNGGPIPLGFDADGD